MRALAAALALTLAGCAVYPEADTAIATAEPDPWRAVASETGRISDPAGLATLALSYPDSGSVRLRLLNAQLGAQDFEGALESLGWLNARGYVFSQGARTQIPELVGEEFAHEARELLLGPPEPVERSEVFASVPATAGLVESVLMDLETGRMVVSSVSGRSVWGIAPDGSWQPIAPEGAGNLSGLVFDPVRNTIWAASGNIDGSGADPAGFSGLVEISPGGTGKRRIAAPKGANLSDLHRAADGSIYASDPLGGGVYVLKPRADTIETLVPPGTFRSPQGNVTSADGKYLYVSDYRYGIAVVPLEGGVASRLSAELPVLLDGVDGLWRSGDELIAVQNGTSPMRIVALRLSEDGLRIVGQRILEMAHPEWTEPLSGYLGRGALYYVGNGQWDRWIGGKPVTDKLFVATQIRKLPLEQ